MSILVYSGLPGSGKTVRSLEWVAEDPQHRLRVNFDDLRVELFGCKGPSYFNQPGKVVREREVTVKQEAEHRASEWLKENRIENSIVVDNTNLTERARSMWVELGECLGIPVEQSDIDTPIAECVRRDRLRQGDDRVGRAIIERMALTTGWIDWADEEVYPFKQFVLVDIDGTLSDPTHRLHHVRDKFKTELAAGEVGPFKPRWDKFHAEVDKDPPKPAIIDLVKALSVYYNIIIVSGRSPEYGCGLKTEDWLDQHLGQGIYQHLFMRQAGDYKPDFEHKQEILDLLPKDRIAFVIDDRDQVVRMWRENGLTCLQCAPGDF